MKTKDLIEELDKIYSLLRLDYKNFNKSRSKTSFLFAKDEVIRGKVVVEYTEINLFLDMILYFYFFPKKGSISNRKHFNQIKKSERFNYFSDHLLEDMSLLKKLRLVKEIVTLPNWIIKDVTRINKLRNILAHSSRVIFVNPSLDYKGKGIFTHDGIKLFLEDSNRIQSFLAECHYVISKHRRSVPIEFREHYT